MSKSVDIQTIADAIGVHRTSAVRRAERECWFSVKSTPKTGGKQFLYPVAALPADVHAKVTELLAQRELETVEGEDDDALRAMVEQSIEDQTRLPMDIRIALCERELAAQSPALPAATGSALPVTQLTDDQRRTAEARMALLAEIDRLADATGVKTAIRTLCNQAAAGKLSPRLAPLVGIANARSTEDRTLSPRTLLRWRGLRKDGGFAALAPKPPSLKAEVPWWAEGLMRHWRSSPQKRPLSEILGEFNDELAGLGLTGPTYAQARHFMKSVGTVERNRGRMGSREIKTLKAYVKRDDSQLTPLAVVLMDGHQYDAEVAHPHHGGPFRPEITAVIDAKTRLLLGFSVGLAESAHAVMDAIRDAVKWGLPGILYTDNGSGYEAAVISGPVVGLLARLHITHKQSIAYNSQARGRSERSHRTIFVASAKRRPTYIGKPMDAQAKQKVHKLTRRDLMGKGAALLPAWRDFVEDLKREVADYNRRPHRSLPTITDTGTGKRRNQSPAEAWQAAIEAGWTPDMLMPGEADDLFRPHRLVTTARGVIRFQNLEYFHNDLVEFGGEQLQGAYEPTDPAFLWVKTLDGRLICKAQLNGHSKGYFPMSEVERALENRKDGRLKRLERQADEIHAERRGPPIEHQVAQIVEQARLAPTPKIIELRPVTVQHSEADRRAERLARHLRITNAIAASEEVGEADLNWHARYAKDPEFTAWQRGRQMIADGLVAG